MSRALAGLAALGACAALLLAWLERAPDGVGRSLDQQIALALALYPLAVVGLPALGRWLAGSDGRRHAPWLYAAALAPPALGLALGAWLGGAEGVDRAGGAALLLTFGLALLALQDLLRLVSAWLAQLAPTALAAGLMLSVVLGAEAVERAPDRETQDRRIAMLVECNPLLVACAALPPEFDPLRMRQVYERTPIGAYYLYRRPSLWASLWRYLSLAGALAALAALLRVALPAR